MSGRRRIKKKKSRKRLTYGVIAVTFILLCFLTYFHLEQSSPPDQTHGDNATPPQAAIVDHLNFTGQSNLTVVNTCIDILESGGLTWAYYKGEDVTVDFYRDLPSYGASLIVLRVHSAIMRTENETISILGLFTSERFSIEAAKKYREDILHDRLVEAFFSPEERAQNISYFGIVPEFVKISMTGEFKDAVVIMMGCEGLGYINISTGARVTYTDMAEAFINKGAKVYIGWNGPVSVNHTDQATIYLLQHLISEQQNIGKAVEKTMEEVGRDIFNSTLKYHPKTIENYTLQNFRSSSTMKVAYVSPAPKALKRTKYLDMNSVRILNINFLPLFIITTMSTTTVGKVLGPAQRRGHILALSVVTMANL